MLRNNYKEPKFIDREFYTNEDGYIMQFEDYGAGLWLYRYYFGIDNYGFHSNYTSDESYWRESTLEEKQLLIDRVEKETDKKFNLVTKIFE